MSIRQRVSVKITGKKRSLKYPVHIVSKASGAPSGAASTKNGVIFWSSATGGVWSVVTANAVLIGSGA